MLQKLTQLLILCIKEMTRLQMQVSILMVTKWFRNKLRINFKIQSKKINFIHKMRLWRINHH